MSSAGGVGQRRQGKKRRAEGTAVARNEGGPVRPGQGYCRHTRQELPGYSPGRGGRLRHFAFRPDTARVAAQEPGIGPILRPTSGLNRQATFPVLELSVESMTLPLPPAGEGAGG